MFHVPHQYRIRKGELASTREAGENGAFEVPHDKIAGYFYMIIASDGSGLDNIDRWEHVSVHIDSKERYVDRCPTWREMCFIKDLFWDETDCVVQYHPAKVDYVNCHPTTLHLWRPVNKEMIKPPTILV